jgi:hypothetical protein
MLFSSDAFVVAFVPLIITCTATHATGRLQGGSSIGYDRCLLTARIALLLFLFYKCYRDVARVPDTVITAGTVSSSKQKLPM